jgi:hypothetical protein
MHDAAHFRRLSGLPVVVVIVIVVVVVVVIVVDLYDHDYEDVERSASRTAR